MMIALYVNFADGFTQLQICSRVAGSIRLGDPLVDACNKVYMYALIHGWLPGSLEAYLHV